jgi:hypothetical protein
MEESAGADDHHFLIPLEGLHGAVERLTQLVVAHG